MDRLSFLGRTLATACALSLLAVSGASAATLPSGFNETTFSGVSSATTLQIAPDGRVFAAQQCGGLRVIKDGALLSTPFVSISVNCANERGLLGIAFSPNYATTRWVYLYYTRSSPQNNVVARVRASASNPDVSDGSAPEVLFVIPNRSNTFHHGGGLQFGNDGMLYASVGDHQTGTGQNLGNVWGKVLRLDPEGPQLIPTSNPFYGTSTGDNRAIYAYGLRNPFTMDIQPGTGRIHVNDVGDGSGSCCEEVNLLAHGQNFGWGGTNSMGRYFGYTASSQGGNAITGGDFYNPANVHFPASYVGRYFFGDYGGGWIRSIMGSGSPGSLTGFASGISGPTDVEVHPDGSMYYAARNSSAVRRICFGTCPTGDLTPTPTPVPTNTPTPTPTPTVPGPTPTPTATSAPNTLPVPTISAPPAGTLYSGGDLVSFAGDCTDAEDGVVPASGFAWDIVFHHNTHTHPGVQFNGVKGGSFSLPTDGEWDPDQLWRINLTCTDSAGGFRTVSRDVLPKTQTLTLNSSPSGLQVSADSVSGPAPQAMSAVVAMKRILDTAAPQTMGGTTYYFEKWSDGGAKRHDFFMPDAPTSLSASFRPASAYSEITPAAAGVTTSTSDTNVGANTVDNNLATRWSGNGDGAWVKFDLGSNKTVGHVGVAVYQGNVRRNRFDIQVSTDNSSWTTVLAGESSGTTTNEETYDFADVAARWVRYLGHGNIGSTNPTMNSVTEVSIFGATLPPNTVVIGPMSYTPATITVDPGTTITWINSDSMGHTVTSDTDLFDSGNIPPGGSWSHTFNDGGTFPYHCTFHPGMTGIVNVNMPPGPTPTPTATNTPTPTPTPTATPTITPTPTETPVPTVTPTPTNTPDPGVYVDVTPTTATASTNDGNMPGNTVDNSLDTRWSGNGDGAWIQWDLGSVRTVGYVNIAFFNGNLRASRFDLQVSTTSATGPWTNVLTNAMSGGTTTALQTFEFADAGARYVRYLGHGNNSVDKPTWNSLSEVEIWALPLGPTPTPEPTNTPTPTPTSTPTPTATPTPTITPTPPQNAEITPPGSAVTASTSDANVASNVVDNNLATRWSGNGDGTWLMMDLGSSQGIGYINVAVYQGNMRSNRFDLQVGSSASGPWTNVVTAAQSSGTTTNEETYDFADVSARYVRYLGHGNVGSSNTSMNSVTEISIFSGNPPITPTATPTATPPCCQPTPTPTPTLPPGGNTPVAINGKLTVCGRTLCNQNGQPIQLRGMSTHGLQWHMNCYNNASMNALADDWKADIIRVSMYVQEGGYETNPAEFKQRADTIIQMAVDRGLYVNIDWHQLSPGDPMANVTRAREYFQYMTQKWGHLPNIASYEICNEPSGVSWSRIKEYANNIIPHIRSFDSDSVILIGTRDWSSFGMSGDRDPVTGPGEIAASPVNFPQVMYVFHMYAASHTGEYRQALSNGADQFPVFVTEWGTQTYTGGGGNNFTESQAYINLMKTKKISWTNWNYSHDPLSGAVFTQGTCPSGPFTGTSNLKPAGVWIRDQLRLPDEF